MALHYSPICLKCPSLYQEDIPVNDDTVGNKEIARVLYICVSCWLLAHESPDLFQAEAKIHLLKAEQIHKITTISTQNDVFFQT